MRAHPLRRPYRRQDRHASCETTVPALKLMALKSDYEV